MTRNEFRQKQYEISVCAGTNQRYHQKRTYAWERWDRFAKIMVGILAIIGACLSVVSASLGTSAWNIASITIAFLAAGFAMALNVLPFAEWSSSHRALFQRWTDLREDVDALEFDLGDKEPDDHLIRRLRDLDAKVHRICGAEPLGYRTLLNECQAIEERSRRPAERAA